MAQVVEAKGHGREVKKQLPHVEIHHAENGNGHVVQFSGTPKAFAKNEGHQMLAEVATHMGVEHESPAEDKAEGGVEEA